MRLDHLGSELDPDSETPLALQVARALAQAIQGGELRPGEALPGTRPLAESLGASRYAVLGALQELELEGFLVLRQGSGAYVADRPPAATPGAWGRVPAPVAGPGSAPAYDLPSQLLPISALVDAGFDLSEGFPDPRLAPQEALARAYQRAVKRHGDQLFGVGEPKGNATLREELARFLRAHRGLVLDPEQILVTRGLRNGLDLALDALLPKGGRLGLEVPGAADLWEGAALHRGVRLAALPGDRDGIDPAVLERELADEPIHALLVRGSPEGGGEVRAARGQALLVRASAQRFAVLEDDSAFPFGDGGLAPLPLAAADRAGTTVYLLSFGRLVAPGVRLGLVAGPRALIDRLARIRRSSELQGDRVLEWAMADLLRDGDLDRYLRRAALAYGKRAERFAAGLQDRLGAWIEPGERAGLQIWISPRPGFDLGRWAAAARALGVKLRRPADLHLPPAAAPRIALGFATLDDEELPLLLDLLRKAAEQAQKPS